MARALPRTLLGMGARCTGRGCCSHYEDYAAVPEHLFAELIGGELHVFPRPASPHTRVASRLGATRGSPFDLGDGGPGGWIILLEPELHFPDPSAPGAKHILVPDLAAWRRERMPEMPDVPHFTLAPDWVCEVLSPSTEKHDREEKMPIYAQEGVRWAWRIDPLKKTLEVYTLDERKRWGEPTWHGGEERARAVPFDAIERKLSRLWER